MMTTSSNLSRIVSSGLTVDGWFTKPDAELKSDVHIAVTFSEGVFGGEKGDQVSFKLKLKRAEVFLIAGRGVKVIKASVADGSRSTPVEITTTRAVIDNFAAKAEVSPIGLGARLSGDKSLSASESATYTRLDYRVIARISNGVPSWEITPGSIAFLSGSPWPFGERRACIEFSKHTDVGEIVVRALVQCREDDLEFSDVTYENNWSRVGNILPGRKDVAAKQFLKKELHHSNLPANTFDSEYGNLALADVILTVE